MSIIKPIKGYDGLYEISDNGSIFKVGSFVSINGSINQWGYRRTTLTNKDGKKKTECFHKLVAQTFIPNPFNKKQVNHIDGNKLNNNIDNLEWVTKGENLKHAYDTGAKTPMIGELHPMAKLSAIDVSFIRGLLSIGWKQAEIARVYNVSRQCIYKIKTNTNWN